MSSTLDNSKPDGRPSTVAGSINSWDGSPTRLRLVVIWTTTVLAILELF